MHIIFYLIDLPYKRKQHKLIYHNIFIKLYLVKEPLSDFLSPTEPDSLSDILDRPRRIKRIIIKIKTKNYSKCKRLPVNLKTKG
ncbi:hypothetical protein PUN28_017290 [Cardiocondyla obscurior]|uniref:Uncharacterized protein n=1 Tax=Cardiocondyla obscurior TaxID=286306 RepID=A0AAW2ERZ8_9HYME